MNNPSHSSVNADNTGKAGHELHSLDANLQGRASFESLRMSQLEAHMAELRKNYPGWLTRLALSPEDRALLQAYGEKELEAARMLLSHQNQVLTIISQAQVSFVAEVVNTMLKTGRAGLKSAAAAMYTAEMLRLQKKLSDSSTAFYNMIEEKYLEAEKRLPPIRQQILEKLETDLKYWAKALRLIQEEFISILEPNH